MSSESSTDGKTIIEVPPSNRRGSSATADSGARFDQDKKEWAAELDDEASAYLCEHFDVSREAVYDFEGLHSGEYDVEDATRALQILDYAGMDKLVDCGDRIVPVAYRFRPQSDRYDVDFSFCVDNGTDKPAEYTKYLTAHREGGFYPTIYAFGVVAPDEQSFDAFHLIDVRKFLDCIEVGALSPNGPYTRAGGVEALYYSVSDLQTSQCIIESFGVTEEN